MRKHLHGLTPIRGVACMWVAVHHGVMSLEGANLPANDFLYTLVIKGWLMVDMFFILSGFIISYVALDKLRFENGGVARFLFKRFARIYPAHIAVLILMALTAALAVAVGKGSSLGPGWTMSGFFEQAFMLNGLGFSKPAGWNLPSWSVSSEALAYALFPVFALLFTKIKSPGGALLLMSSIIGTTVFMAWKINVGQKYMLGFEYASVRVVSEFLLGMGLYRLYQSLMAGRFVQTHKLGLFLALTGMAGVFLQMGLDDAFYDFLYLGHFCLIILGLAMANVKRPVPILNFLGNISYSLYLIHSLVIIGLNQAIRAVPVLQGSTALVLTMFFALSIPAAWLLYRLVELPAQAFLLNLRARPYRGRSKARLSLARAPEAYAGKK